MLNLNQDYSCEGVDGMLRTFSDQDDCCGGFIDSTFVDSLDGSCAETIQTNVEKAVQTAQQ